MDDTTTVKVEVTVPYAFCQKCCFMELNVHNAFTWHEGTPLNFEYTCANAYICRNAVEMYKGEKGE